MALLNKRASETPSYYQYRDRSRQTLSAWLNAYIQAERNLFPNRKKLIDVYEYVMLDNHLSAIIQNRKNKILGEKFVLLNPNNEPDTDSMPLFERQWFRNFLDFAMDSLFFGYSLIELGEVENESVSSCKSLDRRHVLPERKEWTDNPYNNIGESWENSPLENFYVFVDTQSLGLLLKITPTAIYKRFAFAGFTEHAEIHHLPTLMVKTNSFDDNARFEQIKNEIINAGRERTLVIPFEDDAEALATNTTGEIYTRHLDFCNSEISKIVNGQTMTSDNGSSRSQSEVHQNVADEYAQNDRMFIESVINEILLPKLVNLGLVPQGLRFCFDLQKQETIENKIALFDMLNKYYTVPESEIMENFGIEVFEKTQPNQDATTPQI